MDESKPRSRQPDAIMKAFLWAVLPTLVLFLVTPSVGNTQAPVVTDITSSGLGTAVPDPNLPPPPDGVYNIIGGTRPGDGPNLFHSFGDFSIGQGDIANFLNDSGLATTNIISRVTGGNISNIDGIIQTTGFGNANLFLVNPSGIIFGPQGSFDVGGSVSFTTAQYLRLFDSLNGVSANFYANPANDGLANSVFAMAPVAAFGFLPAAYGFLTQPDPSATITVQGSTLSVLPGQSISLVGREVVIQGAALPDGTVQQQAHLSAPDGSILLASAASPGEFDVATVQALQNVDGTPFTSFGSVSLALGSSINVTGANTVFVKGGQLVLSVNDATLTTTSDSSADSGTISLGTGSSIVTSNSGSDPSADVQITVETLQMDGAIIQTINSGDRDGGNISINATTVGLSNSASVMSSTGFDPTTFAIGGSGSGGNVTVQGLQGLGSAADSVTLSNGATITTGTALGLGDGGDVRITADTLMIKNASGVSTDTLLGGGVGGDLSLNVGMLTLTGGDFGGSTILTSNGSGADLDGDGVVDIVGVGGNVTIQGIDGAESAADPVVVLSGGSRIAITSEVGDGGQLSIEAKSLNLDGTDLNGTLTTIGSSAFGVGHGGSIVVSVGEASLSGGATIVSQTSVFVPSDYPDPTAGAGGSITVQGLNGDGSKADSLDLEGFRSGIIAETNGNALPGDIVVHAKTVSLTDRAVIEGGDPQANGTGGAVSIAADSVGIIGGSHISSQARAQDAGRVTITADRLTLDNGSIVTTTASEIGGRGGDVVLTIGSVSLANGSTINSSTSQAGPAGDITMTVGTLSLANGSSISSASTGTDAVVNPDGTGTTLPPGTAGNVVITATGSFTSDASTVKTSAEANHGGDISITADSVQLSNGTVMTANSNAPLVVTKLVLNQDGQLVPQVVGDGNAGNITAHSNSTFVMSSSSITTEATQASGGQITITAPQMVQLNNSKISTSVAGSDADTSGGNITIDPQFVVLQNSQILAKAFAGTGGAIDITATSAFIADTYSIVSASSTLGISGTVNIQSPLQNVGGELTALSQEFSSAAALLAQQCAARAAGGTFSTFVVAAREGLPMEPGGFLASPSLTAELLGSRLSGRDLQTQLSGVTGLFPKYDARPIQLAKFGGACH